MSGKALSSGKIKWLSLTGCVIVLLVAVLALAQGAFSGTQGAHAASAKRAVSSPKHASSPSRVGKSKPVMSAAPLSLSFRASAAASAQLPPTQIVTVKNSGTRALYWLAALNPSTTTWVTLLPRKTQALGIRTSSDQPGQLTVGVNPAGLSIGTYTAQITLTGTDQQSQAIGGSPQTIAVTLTVS